MELYCQPWIAGEEKMDGNGSGRNLLFPRKGLRFGNDADE